MQDVPKNIFKLDAAAATAGGAMAGAYLDKIGKFDLAHLTPDEWQTFCENLVFGSWAYALDRHVAEVESAEPSSADGPKPDLGKIPY